jgi:glycogen synthase
MNIPKTQEKIDDLRDIELNKLFKWKEDQLFDMETKQDNLNDEIYLIKRDYLIKRSAVEAKHKKMSSERDAFWKSLCKSE